MLAPLVPPSAPVQMAEPRAAPDLGRLAWMQGEWRGEDGPERLDAHWCLAGRSLVGFCRTLAGETSTAFEVLVLEPAPEGWVLRLRRFGPSLDTTEGGGTAPLRLRVVEADHMHLLLEGLDAEGGTRLEYRLEAPRQMAVTLTRLREGRPRTRTLRLVRTP